MKEYGRYLPLELHSGNEWYSERSVSGMGVARFNSGRTALWAAMKQLGAKRVVLPAYYCPSVVDSLQNDGFSTITYPIGKDLLPVLEGYNLYDDDVLLLVNYFGLLDEPLRSIASRFRKVVIDDALAFFPSRSIARA